MYNRKLEPSSYYKQQDLPLQHKQQDLPLQHKQQDIPLQHKQQDLPLQHKQQDKETTRHMNIKIKRTTSRQAHTKQTNSKPQQDT
jgi:hypothetical protein